MASEDTVYHKLRKEIDNRMPVGMPATESGVEIELLKNIFTEEEAKIAIHLSALPEPVNKIHKRMTKTGLSISMNDLEKILDGLVDKGAIMGGKLFPKPNYYSLAQFAVGIYEFQVDQLTKEVAELSEKYMMEKFHQEVIRNDRPVQLHTIPVEKSLTPEHHVSTYDNIRDIIDKKKGPFTVINCVCRQTHDLIEDSCKSSDIRHCCVMFQDLENLSHGREGAEEVTKDELLNLIKTWNKAGFVLQPENAKNPRYMCVCCGCCCGILTSAKQYPKPAEYYSSNFYAQSNSELCNGCETCVSRCPMDAISMVDEKSVVNLDRCIGCGNCVPYCGMKAMTLVKKGKEKIPPKNTIMLYAQILAKKRGIVGMLSMAGKKLLGKKV